MLEAFSVNRGSER